jgi:hypothetical protein
MEIFFLLIVQLAKPFAALLRTRASMSVVIANSWLTVATKSDLDCPALYSK